MSFQFGPGYWLDALDHIDRGDYRGAVTDAAKAARVGIPYAIGGNMLRRGQELGRFAPTVREGAALVGLAGSVAAEHDGRNPLYPRILCTARGQRTEAT